LSTELDDAAPQPACLALGANESPIEIDDQVVALIEPEWNKQPVTTPNQLSQDDGLCPLSNLDGMVPDVGRSIRKIESQPANRN
jgi:hypothetical protein